MRLTKLKIAGFKSFVDPTNVNFPSNLTGVVGPNGCGKSNIIDAVRWVMGEISAKHLRGESMADVIFNGSSARKPLGAASVELVFDNADGKFGGAYATYAEVSLRRAVSRDGQSDYYINGAKVRRKDITALFLGTGLGTRSYAIIEQGMISRVIDARPDDLRSFLEEAAGISRYKERRRETESRISHTRENLDRLNDLREEVDKQIRHLQRQAASARRYQTLKEEERKLLAEVLALRLQGLDREAHARDAAAVSAETLMQGEIASLREAEAQIERLREEQIDKAEVLSAIQARFFGAGSEVTRIEQGIQYSRELRQRQQHDLHEVEQQVAELSTELGRDRAQLEQLAAELVTMGPQLDAANESEVTAARMLVESEQALAGWQQAWDAHSHAVAQGQRETQVERARIEQLDSQQRRLLQQQERLQTERHNFAELQPTVSLEGLEERSQAARSASQKAAADLQQLLGQLQDAREAERAQAQTLNSQRTRQAQLQGTLVSTEALQQAALGKAAGKVSEWLKSKSLEQQPRVAQQLRVERGWERAVETVLGAYLEAVCVDGIDAVAEYLSSFDGGQLAVVSTRGPAPESKPGSLLSKVQGTPVLAGMLASVHTTESLNEALRLRHSLGLGESVVTRDGIWLAADWLRVARDADPRSGVIEREERLRELRVEVRSLSEEVAVMERQVETTRERVRTFEDQRDHLQQDVNRLHREQVDRTAELEGAQARMADAARRLALVEAELADVAAELARSESELRSARGRMELGIESLAALEPKRVELEHRREQLRDSQTATRASSAQLQQQARELALQVQSRRSSHGALTGALSRIEQQLQTLHSRQGELARQLSDSEAPLAALEAELEQGLRQRANVEGELTAAKIASDELDALLRERDTRRQGIEQRVENARAALDDARLAAQNVRVRRETVAEQFVAMNFELEPLLEQLPAEASMETWEAQLAETRGKIERLGSVNLAAIGEFKEQSERKEYLDRQCKDLTDALETLESAMRKIDRETRTRFEDTFNRVNAGLKEKFPRLFGGGHAYLEVTGEDVGTPGVSIMARPPGKRNSTISQLSGGEKALTAVALVFSIFDLNPAPFCLLDEVDAPLDENNVGRFCDIVREMSRNVQFIFITHNKTTMEMAAQLVGVTQNEPGVSRLVAVDVDEAVRMAAV